MRYVAKFADVVDGGNKPGDLVKIDDEGAAEYLLHRGHIAQATPSDKRDPVNVKPAKKPA